MIGRKSLNDDLFVILFHNCMQDEMPLQVGINLVNCPKTVNHLIIP